MSKNEERLYINSAYYNINRHTSDYFCSKLTPQEQALNISQKISGPLRVPKDRNDMLKKARCLRDEPKGSNLTKVYVNHEQTKIIKNYISNKK